MRRTVSVKMSVKFDLDVGIRLVHDHEDFILFNMLYHASLCASFGLDQEGEEAKILLPLVEKALKDDLPPDYKLAFNEGGVPFYYNTTKGESSWKHPKEDLLRKEITKKMDGVRLLMLDGNKIISNTMTVNNIKGIGLVEVDESTGENGYVKDHMKEGRNLKHLDIPFRGHISPDPPDVDISLLKHESLKEAYDTAVYIRDTQMRRVCAIVYNEEEKIYELRKFSSVLPHSTQVEGPWCWVFSDADEYDNTSYNKNEKKVSNFPHMGPDGIYVKMEAFQLADDDMSINYFQEDEELSRNFKENKKWLDEWDSICPLSNVLYDWGCKWPENILRPCALLFSLLGGCLVDGACALTCGAEFTCNYVCCCLALYNPQECWQVCREGEYRAFPPLFSNTRSIFNVNWSPLDTSLHPEVTEVETMNSIMLTSDGIIGDVYSGDPSSHESQKNKAIGIRSIAYENLNLKEIQILGAEPREVFDNYNNNASYNRVPIGDEIQYRGFNGDHNVLTPAITATCMCCIDYYQCRVPIVQRPIPGYSVINIPVKKEGLRDHVRYQRWNGRTSEEGEEGPLYLRVEGLESIKSEKLRQTLEERVQSKLFIEREKREFREKGEITRGGFMRNDYTNANKEQELSLTGNIKKYIFTDYYGLDFLYDSSEVNQELTIGIDPVVFERYQEAKRRAWLHEVDHCKCDETCLYDIVASSSSAALDCPHFCCFAPCISYLLRFIPFGLLNIPFNCLGYSIEFSMKSLGFYRYEKDTLPDDVETALLFTDKGIYSPSNNVGISYDNIDYEKIIIKRSNERSAEDNLLWCPVTWNFESLDVIDIEESNYCYATERFSPDLAAPSELLPTVSCFFWTCLCWPIHECVCCSYPVNEYYTVDIVSIGKCLHVGKDGKKYREFANIHLSALEMDPHSLVDHLMRKQREILINANKERVRKVDLPTITQSIVLPNKTWDGLRVVSVPSDSSSIKIDGSSCTPLVQMEKFRRLFGPFKASCLGHRNDIDELSTMKKEQAYHSLAEAYAEASRLIAIGVQTIVGINQISNKYYLAIWSGLGSPSFHHCVGNPSNQCWSFKNLDKHTHDIEYATVHIISSHVTLAEKTSSRYIELTLLYEHVTKSREIMASNWMEQLRDVPKLKELLVLENIEIVSASVGSLEEDEKHPSLLKSDEFFCTKGPEYERLLTLYVKAIHPGPCSLDILKKTSRNNFPQDMNQISYRKISNWLPHAIEPFTFIYEPIESTPAQKLPYYIRTWYCMHINRKSPSSKSLNYKEVRYIRLSRYDQDIYIKESDGRSLKYRNSAQYRLFGERILHTLPIKRLQVFSLSHGRQIDIAPFGRTLTSRFYGTYSGLENEYGSNKTGSPLNVNEGDSSVQLGFNKQRGHFMELDLGCPYELDSILILKEPEEREPTSSGLSSVTSSTYTFKPFDSCLKGVVITCYDDDKAKVSSDLTLNSDDEQEISLRNGKLEIHEDQNKSSRRIAKSYSSQDRVSKLRLRGKWQTKDAYPMCSTVCQIFARLVKRPTKFCITTDQDECVMQEKNSDDCVLKDWESILSARGVMIGYNWEPFHITFPESFIDTLDAAGDTSDVLLQLGYFKGGTSTDALENKNCITHRLDIDDTHLIIHSTINCK